MIENIPLQQEIPQDIEQNIKKNSIEVNNLFKRSHYFIEDDISFRSGSQHRSGFKLTLWSWMSAFIDTLILISTSCFAVVLFSFVMRTPMREILNINTNYNLFQIFVVSFLINFWLYLNIMRIFMGASLGEWSCQLRLGQPVQRIKTDYVLRVIARTSLMLLTGVVLLPLISIISKKDIAGELTGLKIYSLT